MTAADYGIVVLILISVLIGIWRGFVRESLGLATWTLALVLTWWFARPLADRLAPYVDTPSLRLAVAGAALFLAGLLVGSVVTALLSGVVRASVLASTDRTLGGGIGLMRGLVLVLAAVWLLRGTPLAEDPWWKSARLIPHLERAAEEVDQLLPERLRDPLAPSYL